MCVKQDLLERTPVKTSMNAKKGMTVTLMPYVPTQKDHMYVAVFEDTVVMAEIV